MIIPTVTKEQALDINFLKANCKKIHFFGLGFIQIKLDDFHRVHVYTDKFPATTTLEEIHNHRYQFNSAILRGKLSQWTFTVSNDKDGRYLLTKETCNPEIEKSTDRAVFCDVKLTQVHHFSAGTTYWTDADTFHRVRSENAVTLITRGAIEKSEADVVYFHETKPTCPFSVKVTEDQLWAIVEEALK